MSKTRKTEHIILGFCSSGNHGRCPGVVSGNRCQCRLCPHDMCADCKRTGGDLTTDTNTCMDAEDCTVYLNQRRAAKAAQMMGLA